MSTATFFPGIPQDGLDFLDELAQNNNRHWFEEHRHRYQALLPVLQSLVAVLGQRLQHTSPGITYDLATNGSGSLMRIYRDTRFSQDKSPYKTRLAMGWWEGPRKKLANPAFGLQFGPEGGELMAGLFRFDREQLAAYRAGVDGDETGARLREILDRLQAAGGYTVNGERYQQVPRGYPTEHPRADLLTYKGLWATSPSIPAKELTGPGLVEICVAHFHTMAPLQRWLVEIFG